MAMAQATLSTALLALVPVPTEAEAIVAFADAIETYALQANAATPILAAGVTLGKAAMPAAMAGLSFSGASAAKYQDGLQAFWDAVAGGGTVSFAGAVTIGPPSMAGLSATLQSVFDANRDQARSLADSMDAIATAIHAATVPGGSVTTPGPTVTGIV